MGRLTKALALALGALASMAVLAGSAAAASPIDLGPADAGPNLALNSAGSAVATYSGEDHLQYCSLAPGGSGCQVHHTFGDPSNFVADTGNSPLISGSSELLVEARRTEAFVERKYLYEGPSDTTPTVLAENSEVGTSLDFTEAALAPANTINTTPVVATVTGGPITEGALLAASGITSSSGGGTKFVFTRNAANTADDESGDATVAVQGTMLSVAYTDLSEENKVYWRRLVGTGNPGFIQNNAHWSAPALVGQSDAGGPVRMVSGPHGLYIAYPRAEDDAVVLQKFNGFNGFEAPIVLTPHNSSRFGIYEDSAGLIHIVWDNPEDGILHYRYAKDGSNTSFSNPQNLLEGDYHELRTVVNSSGQGWLTWLDDSSPNHAHAMELQPGEPPAPAPPAPPAPSGGGNKSGGGNSGPVTTVTKSLGHGLVGQLSVPKGCVAGGSKFTAKLAVKAKGSKAKKLSYTVKQVKFSAGGKPVTDKKKPFEASFVAKGKSLTVAAAVKVNLHIGKRHTTLAKTLTAKVATCG